MGDIFDLLSIQFIFQHFLEFNYPEFLLWLIFLFLLTTNYSLI